MPTFNAIRNAVKVDLVADTPTVLAVHQFPATFQVPSGVTARIETTCHLEDDVRNDTAEWLAWPAGDKPGPFVDVLEGPVTAVRLTSLGADGAVYMSR